MHQFQLTQKEEIELRIAHRQTKNKRKAYRINALLLLSEGWTYIQVSQALLLDEGTLRSYVKRYQTGGLRFLLKDNNPGSSAKLSCTEINELCKYLEENLLDARPSNFCVGVSAYPEKHFESPNLDFDIKYLKQKVEAGAEYIVTQMFFDNRVYFEFVDKCRAQGITVPIIPGLKIVSNKNQVVTIPRNFHVDIPSELTNEVMGAKEEHVVEIGVNWTLNQFKELLDKNVPAVHFYILQDSGPINRLMKKI